MKGKSVSIYLMTAVCLALFLCSTTYAAEFDHVIQVKKIRFAWKIEGADLHVRLSAHTKGWVGVGFNPTDMMKDAKFVLGYVKNGKTVVSDEFGAGTTRHEAVEKIGGKSDVNVIGGREERGVTTIEFSIPLVSTDSKGKKIDPNAMTTVLLAYGPDFDSFLIKHRFRTKLSVNLSTGKYNQK